MSVIGLGKCLRPKFLAVNTEKGTCVCGCLRWVQLPKVLTSDRAGCLTWGITVSRTCPLHLAVRICRYLRLQGVCVCVVAAAVCCCPKLSHTLSLGNGQGSSVISLPMIVCHCCPDLFALCRQCVWRWVCSVLPQPPGFGSAAVTSI